MKWSYICVRYNKHQYLHTIGSYLCTATHNATKNVYRKLIILITIFIPLLNKIYKAHVDNTNRLYPPHLTNITGHPCSVIHLQYLTQNNLNTKYV